MAVTTFAVAVLALPARATSGARVTADEPYYLLTALSLGEDLDLDIADELADGRAAAFHELPLDPQTVDLDGRGQRISPHDPLLPLLLAPGMALGGWVGAKVALALLAAATAAATVWVAVRRLGVAPGTAGVVIGLLFAGPPLTAYATQVYPEMPAALATVVAVGAVTGRRSSPPTRGTAVVVSRVGAVVAIVALPWLSVKYVPAAAVLACGLLWPDARWRSGRRSAVLSGAALVVAGIVYLVVHRRIYGGWTVYAAGDHFVGGELEVVGRDPDYLGRSRRLVGLLVDRRFGLVAWNPALLLAVPALARMARRRPAGWLVMLGVVASTWAVATWVALTMHGWWWPGRQVVVALPVIALAVAGLVDEYRWLRPPLVIGALLGVVDWLWLVVESSTGHRTLIVDFAQTDAPWYRVWSTTLPDHMTFEAIDVVLTAGWSAALLAAAMAAWRAPVAARPALAPPVPARRPGRNRTTDTPVG